MFNISKQKRTTKSDISNKNQEMSFKMSSEAEKDFEKKLEAFLNTEKNP